MDVLNKEACDYPIMIIVICSVYFSSAQAGLIREEQCDLVLKLTADSVCVCVCGKVLCI